MQDTAARVADAAQASCINFPRCVQAVPLDPAASDLHNITLISRDAVSHLMHLRGLSTIPQNPFLVDVRRRDEVTLFGAIAEAKHLPLLDLIFAFAAPSDEFESIAGFARPDRDQLLVFISRVNERAKLAASIALDHGALASNTDRQHSALSVRYRTHLPCAKLAATRWTPQQTPLSVRCRVLTAEVQSAGYERVLVCKGGTNGWGIDSSVLPYAAYGAHEPPPPAGRRAGGKVDIDEAAAELRKLGVL